MVQFFVLILSHQSSEPESRGERGTRKVLSQGAQFNVFINKSLRRCCEAFEARNPKWHIGVSSAGGRGKKSFYCLLACRIALVGVSMLEDVFDSRLHRSLNRIFNLAQPSAIGPGVIKTSISRLELPTRLADRLVPARS